MEREINYKLHTHTHRLMVTTAAVFKLRNALDNVYYNGCKEVQG